jgi:hypothetical protein
VPILFSAIGTPLNASALWSGTIVLKLYGSKLWESFRTLPGSKGTNAQKKAQKTTNSVRV